MPPAPDYTKVSNQKTDAYRRHVFMGVGATSAEAKATAWALAKAAEAKLSSPTHTVTLLKISPLETLTATDYPAADYPAADYPAADYPAGAAGATHHFIAVYAWYRYAKK